MEFYDVAFSNAVIDMAIIQELELDPSVKRPKIKAKAGVRKRKRIQSETENSSIFLYTTLRTKSVLQHA